MWNPILRMTSMLRSFQSRGWLHLPLSTRIKRPRDRIAVGKPHGDPLAARNRNRFQHLVSSLEFHKSIPGGNRGNFWR